MVEEVEVGGVEPAAPPPPEPSLSIRENLERGFEQARHETEEPVEDERPRKRGRFASEGPRGSKRTPEPEPVEADGTQTGSEAAEPAEASTEGAAPSAQAPAAWAKEAKETWAQLPPAAQQAILKREQDVERGVKELKGRYSALDQALAPYSGIMNQYGKSPAEAVSILFQWMNGIAQNPVQAVPALFRQLNVPPQAVMAIGQQLGLVHPSQVQGQQTPQEPQEAPPEWQSAISGLEQRLGQFAQGVWNKTQTLEQQWQQENLKQTYNYLGSWAKDKPYFEEVRVLMGQLMTPDPTTGVAPVALRQDGSPDLDTAYEMAIWAHPNVRTRMEQDKITSAVKAEQDKRTKEASELAKQAVAARRKAVSVPVGTSPGANVPKTPDKRGKSVKDSIRDAIQEVRG